MRPLNRTHTSKHRHTSTDALPMVRAPALEQPSTVQACIFALAHPETDTPLMALRSALPERVYYAINGVSVALRIA